MKRYGLIFFVLLCVATSEDVYSQTVIQVFRTGESLVRFISATVDSKGFAIVTEPIADRYEATPEFFYGHMYKLFSFDSKGNLRWFMQLDYKPKSRIITGSAKDILLVATATHPDVVYAISMDTGRHLWKVELGSTVVRHGITGNKEALFYVFTKDMLYNIDFNGRIVWKKDIKEINNRSIRYLKALSDGRLIGVIDSEAFILSKKHEFEHFVNLPQESGRIYVPANEELSKWIVSKGRGFSLMGLNATGVYKDFDINVDRVIAIDGDPHSGVFYVLSRYGWLFCVDAKKVKVRWIKYLGGKSYRFAGIRYHRGRMGRRHSSIAFKTDRRVFKGLFTRDKLIIATTIQRGGVFVVRDSGKTKHYMSFSTGIKKAMEEAKGSVWANELPALKSWMLVFPFMMIGVLYVIFLLSSGMSTNTMTGSLVNIIIYATMLYAPRVMHGLQNLSVWVIGIILLIYGVITVQSTLSMDRAKILSGAFLLPPLLYLTISHPLNPVLLSRIAYVSPDLSTSRIILYVLCVSGGSLVLSFIFVYLGQLFLMIIPQRFTVNWEHFYSIGGAISGIIFLGVFLFIESKDLLISAIFFIPDTIAILYLFVFPFTSMYEKIYKVDVYSENISSILEVIAQD